MQLIRGREIADNILADIKSKIDKLKIKPTLVVFLIGEDEASRIYVGLKEKAARDIGMDFRLFKYDSGVDEIEILNKIEEANKDNSISGIIVQLPLPEGLDKNRIINAISPGKDVDGFHCENQKKFCCGDECKIFPVFPKAIMKMVEIALINLEVKKETPSVLLDISPFEYKVGEGSVAYGCTHRKAAIVCVSDDFGTIMQEAFKKINIQAQYIFCDSLANNLEKLKEADVIVTACGIPNLINSKMTKSGVIIIDGGITKLQEKVVGDVDINSFQEINSFISPVPGGVGPVTVACLLENAYLAKDK